MYGFTQLRLTPKTAPRVFFFLPSLSSSVNQEYPTLTTFFAGEIISQKRPFLTRKWDADEDVDRKHWVGMNRYCAWADEKYRNGKKPTEVC